MSDQQKSRRGVAVFSPGPRLTITIEQGSTEVDEPHLHVGGQGPWAARMASMLGADVHLCLPLGGETGSVAGHLLSESGLVVKAISIRGDTAMYLHDRRGGQRHELAATAEPPLDRHEFDDLYNVFLGAALECGVALLTGTEHPDAMAGDTYGRLVDDLRHNGVLVVIDLSGPQLQGALSGGPDLVKVSHTELHECGLASGTGPAEVNAGLDRLVEAGAVDAIVTRAAEPALAVVDGQRYELVAPRLEAVEHRGAGDSLTGAAAAALAAGKPVLDALRLGSAAGALNVTRHGLATGVRETIEELWARVEVRPAAPAHT